MVLLYCRSILGRDALSKLRSLTVSRLWRLSWFVLSRSNRFLPRRSASLDDTIETILSDATTREKQRTKEASDRNAAELSAPVHHQTELAVKRKWSPSETPGPWLLSTCIGPGVWGN